MVAMTQTVLDAFGDSGLAGWSSWAGGNAVETGGQLQISTSTGGGYWGIDYGSTVSYDGHYYGALLADPGDIDGLDSYNVSAARAVIDGANNIYWLVRGSGDAQPYLNFGNSFTPVGSTLAYDPDVHKYFAVGINAGQIEWVWSTDGADWTVHHTASNPFGTTSFKPSMMVGQDAPEAGTTTAAWDDFSVWERSDGASLDADGDRPITATISGSISLQAGAAGDQPLTVTITGDLAVGGVDTASGDLPLTVAISGDLAVTRGPTTITLPAGVVPVRSLSTLEILTGNRHTRTRYDLLTAAEAPKGTLTGVEGGAVYWVATQSVHGKGDMTVVDVGQDVDWLNDRIRPVMLIDGLPEQPLGVYLASEGPEDWGDTGRTWEIKLVDKTSILDQDAVDETYALDAGAVVTDEIVTLIESTGETNHAITPSTATLTNGIVWEPGTSKLRIVNDLLAIINYFSLYCDHNGQYRGEPYVRPANRPILWEFLDGDKSIYSPDFVRDVNLYGVPNKVVAVSQGSGGTPALVSEPATNDDPLSPYSTVSRGRTITHTETGVEIADQSTLDDYARRRLIELSSPTSAPEVMHAFVPGLTFNDAVWLRRVPAGINHRHVVARLEVSLDPTALTRSIFRQVVDL